MGAQDQAPPALDQDHRLLDRPPDPGRNQVAAEEKNPVRAHSWRSTLRTQRIQKVSGRIFVSWHDDLYWLLANVEGLKRDTGIFTTAKALSFDPIKHFDRLRPVVVGQ